MTVERADTDSAAVSSALSASGVAIVVPTLNAAGGWGVWERAFKAQTFQPAVRLVVDSSSKDDTAALARADGFEVRVIARSDFDHGGTRQKALESLENAEFVIFLTQDAVLADPRALENLLAAFKDPSVGAVFGRQLPRPVAGPIEAHARLFNYPPKSRVKSLTDASELGIKTAFISNSFAAYRRKALLSVGGFPSNTILSEDTYAAAKLLLAGWKIAYQADARVFHSHGYTIAEEFKRYFDIGVFHAREPWIRQRFGPAEGEGFRYLRSELGYLLKNNALLLPAALARSAAKIAGYRLGAAEGWLPARLKARLSMHSGYWKRALGSGAGARRTAIVHDWLVTPAGAEKALASIHAQFPAPVYTLVYRPETAREVLGREEVHASWLQGLPYATSLYRNFLPLFPRAVESFDLSAYDLILSSSHAAVKGVRKSPGQLHICYCYTPMRYAWDLHEQYMASLDPLRRALARPVLARLRRWDKETAARVDHFVAISRYVAERIRRIYGREAAVIYPPVDVDVFVPPRRKGAHFVTVSRLVPYKRVDLIVEAFTRLGLPLVVVGTGPEFKRIEAKAGPTIRLTGRLESEALRQLVAEARAFVFAAEEDFGIAPVEALACGTPVIGYGVGGLAESVEDGVHGVHFKEQTVEALCAVVKRFIAEEKRFDPQILRRQAERFSRPRFEREFKAFVDEKWAQFKRPPR